METWGLFVLCPDESPFSLLSKHFWHNGHPNLSFDRQCQCSLDCIYSTNLSQLSQSVSWDAMAYVGLCFWITLETQNRAKDQISSKVNLKWEQNTKRVNGMIPKDQIHILKYFLHYCQKEKQTKRALKIKKNIYLYIHHMYIYI